MMPLSVQALHAPDGFFSLPVVAVGSAMSVGALAYAARRASREGDERALPLMGVTAAFIFAAQMINFPVAGGTSGHLVGSALAAILLGPWAAMLVMASVVAVQALVFQDGGLLVLGVNVFNMAVLAVLAAWLAFRLVPGREAGPRRFLGASFLAGWASVVVTAVAVAVELALSHTSPLTVALPAMGGVHALIGLAEGLITASALALVRTARPDLIRLMRMPERG